jgi:hypothetical protein
MTKLILNHVSFVPDKHKRAYMLNAIKRYEQLRKSLKGAPIYTYPQQSMSQNHNPVAFLLNLCLVGDLQEVKKIMPQRKLDTEMLLYIIFAMYYELSINNHVDQSVLNYVTNYSNFIIEKDYESQIRLLNLEICNEFLDKCDQNKQQMQKCLEEFLIPDLSKIVMMYCD